MGCSPPGSSVHGDSSGKNTGVGCHALLQGIIPTQGLNQASTLQVDSLPSEPPGKPKYTEVGSLSLLQGIFLTQESNQGLPHCRYILYQLSCQGSPVSCDHLLSKLYSCLMDHFPGKPNEMNAHQHVTETLLLPCVSFRVSVCQADPFPMQFKSWSGHPQTLSYFRTQGSSLWRQAAMQWLKPQTTEYLGSSSDYDLPVV